jgi:Cys-rich protein (TIGR01571 family)
VTFSFYDHKPVAAGQVINRLQFTWRGTPSRTAAASARAFGVILYITVFHWLMYTVLQISIILLDPNLSDDADIILDLEERKPLPRLLLFIVIIYKIFQWMYIGITAYVLWSLRTSVRTKYGIPGDSCSDGLWSLFCPCLVAGQLLRHTTDYEVYPSHLCSSTGLSKNAPIIV